MGAGIDRREQILVALRTAAEPLTIGTLAAQIQVHPNTVRFHLDALIKAGRIEAHPGPVGGPGRPPVTYRAVRAMDRNGRSNYQLLATMLASHLATTSHSPRRTATALGRQWGPSLVTSPPPGRAVTKAEALTRLDSVLEEIGFQPEPHHGARSRRISLRHCPFLDVVDDHADVVCALHLGLMQGVLAAVAGPVTVDRLVPFAEPDRCVAHLAAT